HASFGSDGLCDDTARNRRAHLLELVVSEAHGMKPAALRDPIVEQFEIALCGADDAGHELDGVPQERLGVVLEVEIEQARVEIPLFASSLQLRAIGALGHAIRVALTTRTAPPGKARPPP